MQVKSNSFLGIRSSVVMTLVAGVLLVLLEALKAMPQTKWVAVAIAVISIILVLINKKNGEETPKE